MKTQENNNTNNPEKSDFPGYPSYPSSEDIYKHDKEEREIDPEQPTKQKPAMEKEGKLNEKNFREDMSGNDLDVPGSELDDDRENMGNEDEENNLYSLGRDKED